ncbi:K(+)-transporting ATPase subunit F [Azospirillum palustre]|uniref:K(+)-transporting ATPase subunit F n=2 Tax=Azospirillum TaxID=191 RepID=A0A2B8BGW1_9PROT|nr:K(+)-transporting ATPase subunit F [Azospirillum palustre]
MTARGTQFRRPQRCSTCCFLRSPSASSPRRSPMSMPATGCEGSGAMSLDYALAGLVTAGLLVYLVYALIRPERF